MAKNSGGTKVAKSSASSPAYTMEQKIDALFDYTSGESYDINQALNRGTELGTYKEVVQQLDQLMSGVDEFDLYRAVQNVPELLDIAGVKDVESLKGKTITQKGYLSTSKTMSAVMSLDTYEPINTVIHFSNINNIKGIDVNSVMNKEHRDDFYFGFQKEVIVQRGAKYKIGKIENDEDGITHIYARFVK